MLRIVRKKNDSLKELSKNKGTDTKNNEFVFNAGLITSVFKVKK